MEKKQVSFTRAIILAAGMIVLPTAHATNGYFLPGFGIKSQGGGGAGIALAQDSLAQAANPASLPEVGMRGDLGGTLFNPRRSSATGGGTGLEANTGLFDIASGDSANRLYLLPDMAFAFPISERLSIGLAVVGNGGMNTTYRQNIFGTDLFGSSKKNVHGHPNDSSGVDMIQLIAPLTVAYKLAPGQSIGVSLNLGAQRFKANGFGQFVAFGISSDSKHLTNQGYDYAYGAGVRVGWLGKFFDDRLSVGATYSSKTYMTKFDKYRGFFAGQGNFDIPANYGLGLAFKPIEKLTAAFDIERINYKGVPSVGNPGPGLTGGSGYDQNAVFSIATGFGGKNKYYSLGNNQGMGFGWKDMTVYKLGLIYDATERLTLRAGYNYSHQPIRRDQLVFSAIAPATVERHYTVGFTYLLHTDLPMEISAFYMYVPKKTLSGCGQAVVDCVSYSLSENALGLGIGVKY